MIGLGLKDRHDWLQGVLGAIIVLNMLDGVFTIGWIQYGLAVEINPLMNLLLSTHPLLFMVVKMLLVSLGVLLLWRFRANTSAVISIYVCFSVYSGIFLYHLGGGIVQLN